MHHLCGSSNHAKLRLEYISFEHACHALDIFVTIFLQHTIFIKIVNYTVFILKSWPISRPTVWNSMPIDLLCYHLMQIYTFLFHYLGPTKLYKLFDNIILY